jgi:hypothetical protein
MSTTKSLGRHAELQPWIEQQKAEHIRRNVGMVILAAQLP